MKKVTLTVLMTLGLASMACANEDVVSYEAAPSLKQGSSHHEEDTKHEVGSHEHFYGIAKALVSLPSTTKHSEAVLTSGIGGGVGIDMGYAFNEALGLEMDIAYDYNKVLEEGKAEAETANYMTYAIDAVYTMELVHRLHAAVKVGYEIEQENIANLHISEVLSGVVYGLSMEYELENDYEIVAEYEQSTIASTHGSSIFTGVKHLF